MSDFHRLACLEIRPSSRPPRGHDQGAQRGRGVSCGVAGSRGRGERSRCGSRLIGAGEPVKMTRLPAGMDAEDAKRLVELAAERQKTIGEVLAELVRNA